MTQGMPIYQLRKEDKLERQSCNRSMRKVKRTRQSGDSDSQGGCSAQPVLTSTGVDDTSSKNTGVKQSEARLACARMYQVFRVKKRLPVSRRSVQSKQGDACVCSGSTKAMANSCGPLSKGLPAKTKHQLGAAAVAHPVRPSTHPIDESPVS